MKNEWKDGKSVKIKKSLWDRIKNLYTNEVATPTKVNAFVREAVEEKLEYEKFKSRLSESGIIHFNILFKQELIKVYDQVRKYEEKYPGTYYNKLKEEAEEYRKEVREEKEIGKKD